MSQIIKTLTSGGPIPPNIPTTFQTDSGNAVPAANVIIFHGVGGEFTGSGNTVTFTVTGTGVPWTDEAISFTAASNNGYFATAALTVLMPAAPAQGDIVFVIADTAGAIVLQANAGQYFRVGTNISVVAGTCTNSAIGDAIEFVYRAADQVWFCANSPQGTWETT